MFFRIRCRFHGKLWRGHWEEDAAVSQKNNVVGIAFSLFSALLLIFSYRCSPHCSHNACRTLKVGSSWIDNSNRNCRGLVLTYLNSICSTSGQDSCFCFLVGYWILFLPALWLFVILPNVSLVVWIIVATYCNHKSWRNLEAKKPKIEETKSHKKKKCFTTITPVLVLSQNSTQVSEI